MWYWRLCCCWNCVNIHFDCQIIVSTTVLIYIYLMNTLQKWVLGNCESFPCCPRQYPWEKYVLFPNAKPKQWWLLFERGHDTHGIQFITTVSLDRSNSWISPGFSICRRCMVHDVEVFLIHERPARGLTVKCIKRISWYSGKSWNQEIIDIQEFIITSFKRMK